MNPADLRLTPCSHFPRVGQPHSGHAASRDADLVDGGGGSVGAKVGARELVTCRPGLPVGQSLQPFSLGPVPVNSAPRRWGRGCLPAQPLEPSLLVKHLASPSTGPCGGPGRAPIHVCAVLFPSF